MLVPTMPFSLGVDQSSSRDPTPWTRATTHAMDAPTRTVVKPSAVHRYRKRGDQVARTRSPDTRRSVARPKSRACEFHEAPNKSPRCRIATNGEHDERCSLTKTGRCALVESRRSPVGRKRPARVAKRPGIGSPPPVPPVVVPAARVGRASATAHTGRRQCTTGLLQ